MSIEKLRVLSEKDVKDFPDEFTKSIIKDAVADYDKLRDLFSKLVVSKIISDGLLLADPTVYNEMVTIFNKY